MQPEGRDIAHLWDMVKYSRIAMELTGEWSAQEYLSNRVWQLALERVMEIIGEAARRVSQPFCDAHPEIPWKLIIGNRNVLAHNYDDIVQEILWTTATRDIPQLVEVLHVLLPPEPEEDE